MRKKQKLCFLVVSIIMILGSVLTITIDKVEGYNGSTLYVGGSGPNNYTKIQTAINVAKEGDTIFVFEESSPYQENINIQKTINLIGENRYTTIIKGNESGDVIYIFADWVNVSEFTITGSGKESSDAGIELHSQYITISNNIIQLNKNHGIFVNSASYNTILDNIIENNSNNNLFIYNSNNNYVRGNICRNAINYYGMSLSYSKNNIIINNTCSNNKNLGIGIWSSSNNSLANNICQQNGGNGVYLSKVKTTQITDNTILDNKANGISIVSSQENIIADNTASTNTQNNIYLENTTNNIIQDNICTKSTSYHGISIASQSHSNTITSNTCTQNHYQGILVVDSNDNHITYNTCQQNEQNGISLSNATATQTWGNTLLENKIHGIRITSSQDNTITNNTCTQNYYQGIYVFESDNNNITHNTLQQNEQNGIYLSTSTSNNIEYNKCLKNRGGITLQSSRDNKIIGNLIMKNMETGLILTNSTSNTIYHNDLIYNNQDARDDKYNTWDNGYPDGGNYWWVFDELTEGAQDTNDDNIIDRAYIINEGNSKDKYPLKKPWGIIMNLPPSCSIICEPSSGYVPLTVSFLLKASDVDGSIKAWAIDANNDKTIDFSDLGEPPKNIQYTYQNTGNYIVNFTVEDNGGETLTSMATISISSPTGKLPICSLTCSPSSGRSPLIVTFSLSASDSDGLVTSWALDTNGNGITEYSGSGLPPPIIHHNYLSKGTYSAKLTVFGNDGQNGTSNFIIVVYESEDLGPNQSPVANFVHSPKSPVRVGKTINFTDNSLDPDGDIVNWTWNFGDGTRMYGQHVSHIYNEPENYNVILTVKDNNGETDSFTLLITVEKENGDGIPGFEMTLILSSITLLLILKRRKKPY